jgi:hypothetical protein
VLSTGRSIRSDIQVFPRNRAAEFPPSAQQNTDHKHASEGWKMQEQKENILPPPQRGGR